MAPGYYLSLICRQCQHCAMIDFEDVPENMRGDGPLSIRPEALARMRCSSCGALGEPEMRIGWRCG